jgi:hypothetical protein
MSGTPTWGAAREAWGPPTKGRSAAESCPQGRMSAPLSCSAERSGAGQLNGQLAARSAERSSAERPGSGAAKSGSEARASAVCRRLHPLVRCGLETTSRLAPLRSRSVWEADNYATLACGLSPSGTLRRD